MKLKIVIEVPMYQARCKCKSKAMRIAASMNGVSSVSIESETNQMVVMGDGVDPVRLALLLRKKFDYAEIVAVEEVKPPPAEEEEEKKKPDPVIEWHPRYAYIWPAAYDSSPSYCTYL